MHLAPDDVKLLEKVVTRQRNAARGRIGKRACDQATAQRELDEAMRAVETVRLMARGYLVHPKADGLWPQ